MSNSKDYNADLGDQTITDTEPPLVFEATVVSADEPIIVAPPADPVSDNLDAQLDALLSADEPKVVTVQPDQPIAAEPDLDAQLDALLNDKTEPTPVEPVILTPPADPVSDNLDAQLDALLSSDEPAPVATTAYLDEQLDAMLKSELTPQPEPQNTQTDNLDAQLDALLNEQPEPTPAEPIILTPPVDARPEQTENAAAQQSATLNEQPAEPVPPVQPVAEPQQFVVVSQQAPEPTPTPEPQPAVVQQPQPQPQNSAEAEAARLMMEQARQMMKQAQEVQAQAVAQTVQVAAVKAQQPEPRQNDAATEAAKEMMRQAQMMLQQAQTAQMQAQAVAQAARTAPTAVAGDPYSSKEVDRLKSELDGMRDLVNKLTISLAQQPQQQQAAPQGVQPPYYFAAAGMDNDHYRKLETELERMRREIVEKDLRDKEKELERKQKEAENTVKDIRPEMIQMSDSRDIAPAPAMNGGALGEYIPLANGVYYSTKDRQIYVMTPASNAAAAKPTIEQPRPAPKRPAPQKRVAARPAAKHHVARRPSAHGRPSGAPHRPLGRPRPKR